MGMKASSQLIDGFNERLMESMRRETRPFLDRSHGGRLNDPRERLKPYDDAVSGCRNSGIVLVLVLVLVLGLSRF
jgi:hypothetical protein